MRAVAIFLFALLLSGCGRTTTHVAGPFYLTYFENPHEMLLFRCPNGPDEGCAGESFPDATFFAAGASEKYIVLARHPYNDQNRSLDRDRTEYFYFARERRIPWLGRRSRKGCRTIKRRRVLGGEEPVSPPKFLDSSVRSGITQKAGVNSTLLPNSQTWLASASSFAGSRFALNARRDDQRCSREWKTRSMTSRSPS